ncbi:mucin-5AC-like isoform X2 [Saccostrea cucullata]|uniref:mucin-5AC-like isoform X2 n=1 Tax=Saccostrea cuccullata TaxID=36930 RepID=UPI002ED2A561
MKTHLAGRYNCKTPKLENGSARIRSKGRLVRYRCKRRYKLFGAKVAVCRNEEWNFPTPVCVANGRKCPKLKKTKDMIIESKLRNGLLKYSCKSGLTLIGNSTLYCDGSKWSSEVPQCIYVEPKKSCDFETADLCDWEQNDSDTPYFDWTRTTAAQIRHSTGTGPSSDHTYPDKETGHYLFMEASRPRRPGDYTTLLSPYYNPVEAGLCFEFWYHMLGRDREGDVGSLKVGIKDADANSSNLDPVWSMSGNQGDTWHKGSLEIGARTSRFQIIITGTRGDDHRGDIAIDDVSITNCTHDSTTTELTATSTSYIDTTLASQNVTTNKAQQPISVTQETSSVQATDKTHDANTVETTTDMTSTKLTIRHTTKSHVTSNVASVTKEPDINTSIKSDQTNITKDITVIPEDGTSISVTAETKTINMKTSEPGIKPITNVETSTAKSFVTTEYKTKPADKQSKAQQITLTTTGYQTKVQTTNGSRNPTTNTVSTSTLSSAKKPTKTRTSTIKSTATATSSASFTEKPTKISTLKSDTTSVTSASRSTTKSAKTNTTTPRTTKQLTTTSTLTSQSRTTTKPTEKTKTTKKLRTTTTTLLVRSTTKPTKISTTLRASTKKSTTTAATSPPSSTKQSVSTTAFRSTRLTTTQMIMTRPTTESSTRKATTKTRFKTTKPALQTTSTTITARPSAPSTKSYQTTLRNFDFYNNTINEDVYVITTLSTNDTDIPNIIVVGRQSASDDPPVRTLLIGLAAGVAVGLVIVVVGCYLWIRRKRRKDLECDEMMPITGTGSQEW